MPIAVPHVPPEEIRTGTSCFERAVDVCFIGLSLRNRTDSLRPHRCHWLLADRVTGSGPKQLWFSRTANVLIDGGIAVAAIPSFIRRSKLDVDNGLHAK